MLQSALRADLLQSDSILRLEHGRVAVAPEAIISAFVEYPSFAVGSAAPTPVTRDLLPVSARERIRRNL